MRAAAAATACVAGVLVLGACSDGSDTPARQREAGVTPSSAAPAPAPAPTAAPEAAGRDRVAVTRPRTAAEAATALVAADEVIADPTVGVDELVRAARAQQLAYRELGTRPAWDEAVLAAVPRRMRDDVRANVASRREFRSMHTTLADTLPAWRIVRPEPAATLLRHYRRAEREHGVPWEYLAAINLVETAMGRIRGTSVAGAQGPMQFIPSTWARWGRGDVQDAGDAIAAAARYLAHHGGGTPRRLPDALYRYNNDVRYVRGVTHLAQVMERDPRAFYGYYHWDVYYLTSEGDVRLPVGYAQDRPVPVERWLRTHRTGG